MAGPQSGIKTEDQFILFGGGSSYACEVYESLKRDGWSIRAFIDNQNQGVGPSELGTTLNVADMPADWATLPVLIPLLTPGHRKILLAQARELGFTRFPAHADPTAAVASTANLAEGVLINAQAVIAALTRIERFAIINRSASVGHHVVVEEFATLGPNCTLCGFSKIGRGSFIGASAVINPKVNIGANSIVGSGALVGKDLPAHCVAVGVPARVVKRGIAGYNDVSV